ncbi:MAG: hypothetical protein AB7P37_05690 [Ramlibacter sp.]
MHNAPAVTYPVGRSSVQGLLCLVIWLLGVAAVAAWVAASPGAARLAAASALNALVGALAANTWWRTPAGQLQWNAPAWQLQLHGTCAVGQTFVALDLQRSLLLRWRPEGGAGGWLWLDRASIPARWDDLRRAVYSRAIVDAPPSSRAATP